MKDKTWERRYKILKIQKTMVMTEKDKKHHSDSKNCYACKAEFGSFIKNEEGGKEKVIKCRDHCHMTGRYRGAACNKCNLRMRVPKFVPILFHNLEGYDAHLFVKSLGVDEGEIKCIPKTDERCISFSKNMPVDTYITKDGKEKTICLEIRFLDSLKFKLGSLDELSKMLGDDKLKTLTSQMSGISEEKLSLLKWKGVFPYEFMTDFSKLSYPCLPTREEFYSKLNDSHCSDEDYEHAQKVWEAFDYKTMKDYMELYLKTDILLLADVMEDFRDLCNKEEVYGLDSLHYYTSPMYQMIEKGKRGGVSTIMRRYSESNHKYLSDYNPNKPSKHIVYLDANNLYGWAMSHSLPYKNFKWMTKAELNGWEMLSSEEGK